MHFLQILYEPSSYDNVIASLKKAFGPAVGDVEVDTILPDQMIRLTWATDTSPNEIAMHLTESNPNVIIETPSDTGIDTNSRYFNGTQLW